MRYSVLKRGLTLLIVLLTAVSVNVRAAEVPGEDDFPPPRQTDYKIQTPTHLSDYFTDS